MQGFILTNEYTMYILFIGDDLMETKVQKWGNSSGIRIPSSILKSLNIRVSHSMLGICFQEKRVRRLSFI